MIDNKYKDTNDACDFLDISHATFYRIYYEMLRVDKRTKERNGHPAYDIESLQEFIKILDNNAAMLRSKRMKKVRARKVRQLRLLGEKDE